MKLPKPPWYGWLDDKLNSVEWLTDAILIIIIVACIALLLKGDRISKTGFAVYLLSP